MSIILTPYLANTPFCTIIVRFSSKFGSLGVSNIGWWLVGETISPVDDLCPGLAGNKLASFYFEAGLADVFQDLEGPVVEGREGGMLRPPDVYVGGVAGRLRQDDGCGGCSGGHLGPLGVGLDPVE